MSNTFGQLLNKYRSRRQLSIDSAERTLKERNQVTYQNAQQFKVEETTTRLPNANEVIELRLWKLVDASVIKLSSEVNNTVEDGITALGDFHSDPEHPLYIAPEAPKIEESDIEVPKNEEKW